MFLHYCALLVGEDLGRLPRLHSSTRARIKAFGLAMHIPVALWALTSHAVATEVFALAPWSALWVSLFCAGLVYVLERLILAVPRSLSVGLLRVTLALLVALLAASTFDLVLFKKEIAQSLQDGIEARLAIEMRQQREQVTAHVARVRDEWQRTQAAANCEANGRCGSGKASLGPIYRELSRQAELLRGDYLQTTQALAQLETSQATALQAAVARAQEEAGLLARMEALVSYLQDKPHARAFWAVLFALVLALELVVMLTKAAFHEETVDDQILRIREDASRLQAQRYLKTLINPAERVRALLDEEQSLP